MTNLLLLGFLPSGSEWIIIALVILLSVSYTHLDVYKRQSFGYRASLDGKMHYNYTIQYIEGCLLYTSPKMGSTAMVNMMIHKPPIHCVILRQNSIP